MEIKKEANYFQQALKMLVNQHDRSRKYLEGLGEDFVNSNSNTSKLYKHYWMSNVSLNNTIDLLKVLNVEQKSLIKTISITCPKCNEKNAYNTDKDSLKEVDVDWLMCGFCNKRSDKEEWE